jgi:hypothetical protein
LFVLALLLAQSRQAAAAASLEEKALFCAPPRGFQAGSTCLADIFCDAYAKYYEGLFGMTKAI